MLNGKMYKNSDLGLLLIRLGVGAVFFFHGWAKLQNIAGTTGFFDGLGLPVFFVYFIIGLELLAGAGMILGILLEYAGWLLAAEMLVAIILVKLSSGWIGMELEVMLLLTSAAIALMGGGKYVVTEKGMKKK